MTRKISAASLLVASICMLGGAVWFGGYPLYTNLRAGKAQGELRAAFSRPSIKKAWGSDLREGSPVTRIVIPSIGTDSVVVEGLSEKALNTGAGHYPMTPLPGMAGNVGIAGHRTMYGKPFARIDELKEGDEIILITPFARHVYRVTPGFGGHTNPYVVAANSWSVVEQSSEHLLTLTACHPKGSSRQRIVVRARLASSETTA